MAELGDVRCEIQEAYQELRNWRAVGKVFGISAAMAWRIAVEGYEPKKPRIRMQLGLVALAPAPVCKVCGGVHVTKRCTAKPRRRRVRDLFAMPVDELRRAIIEREEWK